MKIATRKITLYILSFVFAICLGAFAFVSMGNTKTVNADDPTVNNLTFDHLGVIGNNVANHNDTAGVYGIVRVTSLHFTTGVYTGTKGGTDGAYDFSDIQSKTTYTGSTNTFGYVQANCYWSTGYKTDSVFNFFYFWTSNQPTVGDTVTIQAGAYFTMAGTDRNSDAAFNDKYVFTNKLILRYEEIAEETYAWVAIASSPFTLDVPYGGNGSGWDGITYAAQQSNLSKFGITWATWNNNDTFIVPTSGTCVLTSPTTNVFKSGSTPSDNIVSSVTGITIDGVELKNISGAVVAEWFTNLFIYIPGVRGGVVKIEKDAIVAGHYAADDYYYVLTDATTRVQWFPANSAANTTAISNNTTAPDADGLLWNGVNSSGSITIAGIAPGVPESGTCNLINMETTVFGSNPGTNLVYATAGETILCDGTPLNEISGAAIGTFANYLFIYVPSDDSIITIQQNTIIGGSGYKIDKDYTYHFKKGSGQSSLCYLVDFDSNGGTEVADVYVHNGATVAAPTAPTKASVGNTDYTFGHWEDEGGDEFNFSTAITANTTLTATWTEVTTVHLTLNNVGGVQAHNNYLISTTYYTALSFNAGVSTGEAWAFDFSHLGAEYSNTALSYSWISGVHLGYAANTKSDNTFNFIYFTTASVPETGATITVKAGGWFTIGGTINDKYVIEQDFSITFDGSAWATLPSYYLWDSRDMSAPIRQVLESKDGDDFVYTMPTDLSFDGYKVFGFAITDNEVEYFYPAGGEHKSSANNLSVIAIVGAFDMNSGASIRITTAETSGIRWTATIDSAAKGHILYWGKTGTTFGTEISADGFSQNYDIATKYWATDTTFSAVLADVNSDYYTTNFTAKAYVDIAYSDGTTARIYADNVGVTRSIRQVAGAALDDVMANWTDRQEEILTAIAGR